MYDVIIRERLNDIWVYPNGEATKARERTFVANGRPLTAEEADEVKAICEECCVGEKDKKVYTNATIYPKGWLSVWIQKGAITERPTAEERGQQ